MLGDPLALAPVGLLHLLMPGSYCDVLLRNNCSVLVGVCISDRWLLAMLAEYSHCAQSHVRHLYPALCDMAWGYDRARCSSGAIFI